MQTDTRRAAAVCGVRTPRSCSGVPWLTRHRRARPAQKDLEQLRPRGLSPPMRRSSWPWRTSALAPLSRAPCSPVALPLQTQTWPRSQKGSRTGLNAPGAGGQAAGRGGASSEVPDLNRRGNVPDSRTSVRATQAENGGAPCLATCGSSAVTAGEGSRRPAFPPLTVILGKN